MLRRAFFNQLTPGGIPPVLPPVGADITGGNPLVISDAQLPIAGRTALTVEVLLYPTGVDRGRAQAIGYQEGPGAASFIWQFGSDTASISGYFSTDTGYYQGFVAYIDPEDYIGRWLHLALVWDGSTVVLYRIFEGENPQLLTTATVTGAILPPANGQTYWPSGRYIGNFDSYFGFMLEHRVWTTARTLQQITDNAFRRIAHPENKPLIAYFPMTGAQYDVTSPDLSITGAIAHFSDASIGNLPNGYTPIIP